MSNTAVKYVMFNNNYELPPNITKDKKYQVISQNSQSVSIEKDNWFKDFYRYDGKDPIVVFCNN